MFAAYVCQDINTVAYKSGILYIKTLNIIKKEQQLAVGMGDVVTCTF